MPKFFYTAKHKTTGETKGGEMNAKDEKALAQQLREEGFLLTSVNQADDSDRKGIQVGFLEKFRTVPLKDRMVFVRNLSVMVSSGLTLSRSIQNLTAQTKNKYFQTLLQAVHDDVQTGKTLSESLARYPAVFNELFVNMVYVGEVSGNLDQVLDVLAVQLEKESSLVSKVKGALMYPAVVIVAMIIIGIIMLTFVLPKILGVFKDMDVTLPPMTQFVISLSDAFRNHSVAVFGGIIGFALGVKVFLKTDAGKRALSFLTLHLPAINNIIIKVNCARFARIYSSLLKSGISVVDGLAIVSRTLSNVYYKDALTESIAAIQKGTELSKIISQYPGIFPVLVSQMIEVGEETGKTEMVLEKLADFYEEEVDQITKNLSSIIEPILMLMIGGGVGFFAVAMMQPMYSVLENIK